VTNTAVLQVRFPLSLADVLVGAGLAVSGAAFQGTFRNALVSESILGVSAGHSSASGFRNTARKIRLAQCVAILIKLDERNDHWWQKKNSKRWRL